MCGAFEIVLEPLQIIARRVQTVDVVDTHAGRSAPADEIEDEPVHFVEDLLILHPQGGELIHVEKAPVVDFLRCDPPVRQPVRLFDQQTVESIEAARLSGDAVEALDACGDQRSHAGTAVHHGGQPPFNHILFARALGDFVRIG